MGEPPQEGRQEEEARQGKKNEWEEGRNGEGIQIGAGGSREEGNRGRDEEGKQRDGGKCTEGGGRGIEGENRESLVGVWDQFEGVPNFSSKGLVCHFQMELEIRERTS